jgi:hypothetical protein
MSTFCTLLAWSSVPTTLAVVDHNRWYPKSIPIDPSPFATSRMTLYPVSQASPPPPYSFGPRTLRSPADLGKDRSYSASSFNPFSLTRRHTFGLKVLVICVVDGRVGVHACFFLGHSADVVSNNVVFVSIERKIDNNYLSSRVDLSRCLSTDMNDCRSRWHHGLRA